MWPEQWPWLIQLLTRMPLLLETLDTKYSLVLATSREGFHSWYRGRVEAPTYINSGYTRELPK